MSRSIFGWSYPPGVTGSMVEAAFGGEGPCLICGKSVDDCICEECPECSAFGCIEHLDLNRLTELWDISEMRVKAMKAEFERRQQAAKYKCICGTEIVPNLRDADYCPTCKDYPIQAHD